MPCAETSFPVANMMTLPAVPKRSSAMYSLSRAAIQEIDCLKVVTPFDAPLVREAFSPDDESEDSSLFPSHQLCLGAPRSHQPTWVDKDGAKPHQSSDNLSPKQILGGPHISLVFGEMWDSTALSPNIFHAKCLIRVSSQRAACSSSTPRISTGNPGERSGGTCRFCRGSHADSQARFFQPNFRWCEQVGVRKEHL